LKRHKMSTWSIVCSTLTEAISIVNDQFGAEDAIQNGNKGAAIPVIGDTTSVVALSDQIYM
jgi:hypothetical protein